MQQPFICIVDAYSTGAELASEFAKYGYRAVHVKSSPSIGEEFEAAYRSHEFAASFVHLGDPAETAESLREFSPAYVIAGTETGVILADQLADLLGVPGNPPSSSERRRNKYKMNEALAACGVQAVRQACFTEAGSASAWADAEGVWPLVVKPLDSAGTDGVYFCHTPHEVETALGRILFQTNRMGSYNAEALVQELLVGQQYFINAVSVDGTHVITEIWKDNKKSVDGASMICDVEELLPYHGEVQEQIRSYVCSVLDALEIREGASHTEIMFTDRGPILIETGARMQGTILHEALVESIGSSHVTTSVLRYADPERFLKEHASGYTLHKQLYCVTLASEETGTLVESFLETKLTSLPSYYAMFHTPEVGDHVERTVDLFSNPGIIYLMHSDRDQILADYARIREWEANKEIFRLATLV
ncbi:MULTISPECIES: ATP-grasp domain-containing protein [Paenibacillus]|uniref:ATP-grasp domain-containing protein n=1 Tax=Paenibacillus TaxID=44249 RepID=UPI0022B8AFF6|nr:ATP-grasp domain-containing protein [Paenibacillus caseinilyticus]MCZ8522861.1 ATP-grasp domain-containing protein [Paenibacillus caseinilyticus]